MDPIFFDVIVKGPGLFGKDLFELGPKKTGTYELMFSPLRPFTEKGSISFINEKLGEIWYDLNLVSEE